MGNRDDASVLAVALTFFFTFGFNLGLGCATFRVLVLRDAGSFIATGANGVVGNRTQFLVRA